MAIRKELIDELMASSDGPLIDRNGLSKELMKALVERMLGGEMNHHLGYEKQAVAGYGSGNSRNGASKKTLKGETGEVTIDVPREVSAETAWLALAEFRRKYPGHQSGSRRMGTQLATHHPIFRVP